MDSYLLHKEEALQRKRILGDLRYCIWLEISPESEEIIGSLRVELMVKSLSATWLDFKGKSAYDLLVNSESKSLVYENNRIVLNDLRIGDNIIELKFIAICSHDGLGLHKITDPVDNLIYFYTQFEPFAANRLFPCFDQPDLKSVFSLTITAPINWTVISNSSALRPPETKEDTLTHYFKDTKEISTYLVAVCAGPFAGYQVPNTPPLGFYCRQSMSTHMKLSLFTEWTKRGLAFYNSFFGFEYPFDKYDQVFVPEFNFVAMENVGCVVFDDKFLFENGHSQLQQIRACNIFLHEMSHMWFGDLVTMKWWDNLWLNESFATFISAYCMSKCMSDIFPEIWLYFYGRTRRGLELDQLKTTHPIYNQVAHTVEIFSFFDSITYEKGAAVLKQLMFFMGEEKFKLSVQRYFQKYQYENTEFKDLIDVMAECMEGEDLVSWAEMWIKNAGVNCLNTEIRRSKEGMDTLRIIQTACLDEFPALRPHAFNVAVFNEEFELISTELCRISTEVVEIQIPRKSFVLIDSDHNDFCKIQLDPSSKAFFTSDLSALKSDLARMLIYGSLQDSTSDLNSLLPFIKSNLRSETNFFNLHFLQRICKSIITSKLNDAASINLHSHEIVEILLEKSRGLEEENKKHLAKKIVKLMTDPSDIETAVGWLENSVSWVTQSTRWEILKKLCTQSDEGREKAKAEAEKDQSLTGQLGFLYCEAACPRLDVKEEVWRIIVERGWLIGKSQRVQMMKGFNQGNQKEVLKGFVPRYFEEVLNMVKHEDLEFSLDFVEHMFPGYSEKSILIAEAVKILSQIPAGRNDIKLSLSINLEKLA